MEQEVFKINGSDLDYKDLVRLSCDPKIKVVVCQSSYDKMSHSRAILDKLVSENEVIYGVNTNMGGKVKWLVPEAKAELLQNNLLCAVASNVGESFSKEIVRAAMLCRLNSLARGNSAISISVFDTLLKLYNSDVVPFVPKLGSLGTSGDLGPLAAVALVLRGKGKAWLGDELTSADIALTEAGIEPAKLGYKDGLALINGTSFMVSVLSHSLAQAKHLCESFYDVSALSLAALGGRVAPLSSVVQSLKQHPGQQEFSDNLEPLLQSIGGVVQDRSVSSELSLERENEPVEGSLAVEDPYSIRCSPQIMGPVLETLSWVEKCVNNELNSSSDNPQIVRERGEAFHCGHFHGQYMSMSADYLKIAMTTLANLSERRIDRLLDPKKSGGLPAFLAQNDSGVRLGLMGAQFLSTSLTAEMRANCNPVSIQSLPSTGDFQDIVSMGLIAAREAIELVDKCSYIVAVEMFLGFQAIDLIKLTHLPASLREKYETFRKKFPFNDSDERMLSNELEYAKSLLMKQSI